MVSDWMRSLGDRRAQKRQEDGHPAGIIPFRLQAAHLELYGSATLCPVVTGQDTAGPPRGQAAMVPVEPTGRKSLCHACLEGCSCNLPSCPGHIFTPERVCIIIAGSEHITGQRRMAWRKQKTEWECHIGPDWLLVYKMFPGRKNTTKKRELSSLFSAFSGFFHRAR